MSFAIIKTGGKQYKVKSGEILKIEKLPDSKPDTKIEAKIVEKKKPTRSEKQIMLKKQITDVIESNSRQWLHIQFLSNTISGSVVSITHRLQILSFIQKLS